MNHGEQCLRLSHAIFKNLPKWLGQSDDYSYILHFPALKQAKIGICPRQIVTYQAGQIMISETLGNQRIVRSDDKSVIEDLRGIIMKDRSYFCMGSIDLNRKLRDEDMPLLLFIQPGIEIHLDYEKKEPIDKNLLSERKSIGKSLLCVNRKTSQDMRARRRGWFYMMRAGCKAATAIKPAG